MKRSLSSRCMFLALVMVPFASAFASCECFGPPVEPPPVTPPPLPVNDDPITTALESEVRRLTQQELDRTLRDVLAEPSNAGSRLLLTDTFTPYDNDYTDQLSSAALIDALDALSVDVATRVLASPDARAVVIPCAPAAPDDAECFRSVVRTNGKRLLRRPLSDDEVEAYVTSLLPYATEQSAFYTTGFDTAVELALRAFLMDPELLFRIEVGTPTGEPGVVRLNPYETATRMSYLLWGSAPDDAMLAEADSGRIDDADVRRALTERMLEDNRAREQLGRFHAMWLGYRAIPTEPTLAALFSRETDALIARVALEERGDYLDVFRLEETFANAALAEHYGLPAPADADVDADGFAWVSTADTGRAGILGHGAVLASFSKFVDTSPTQRGILVKNRLLCEVIEPPPPNVVADQPPPPTEDAVCKEDRYAAHTQNPSCFACHSQMDPIGFGLENYDINGRFRTTDDGLPECTITGVGELPGYGAFSGPRELAHKLVDDEVDEGGLLSPCFVQQLTSFEIGRPLSLKDEDVALAWHEQFQANGRRLDALLVEQIAGEQFVTKREPSTEGGGP